MNPLEALRALEPSSAPPPGAEERVYERVLAATAPMGLGLERGSSRVAKGTSALVHGLVWRSKPALMLVSWLIGGGMGAAIYGALRPPVVRFVPSPPATSIPTAAHPLAMVVGPPSAPRTAGSVADAERISSNASDAADRQPGPLIRNAAALPVPVSSASILARERAVLDIARAKAAAGEPAQVLEQVERHQRQFPTGHLAEEREALAIRALLNLGRTSEAQARARAFVARYPNSLLSSAVESALAP